MNNESSLVNLLSNATPASRTLYNYLDTFDIQALSSTSKTAKNIIDSYTYDNNNYNDKFIKDQIYNVYLDSLCQLMYSVVTVYRYQINNAFTFFSKQTSKDEQLRVGLYSSNITIEIIPKVKLYEYEIIISINSSDTKLTKYINNYLSFLDIKSTINEDEEKIVYSINETESGHENLNLYKFTYFIKNFKPVRDNIVTFRYNALYNNVHLDDLDYRETINLLRDGDLLYMYKDIEDVFHPTKYNILDILDYISLIGDMFSRYNPTNVQTDLGLKYNYLFKNKDFINFIKNIL